MNNTNYFIWLNINLKTSRTCVNFHPFGFSPSVKKTQVGGKKGITALSRSLKFKFKSSYAHTFFIFSNNSTIFH